MYFDWTVVSRAWECSLLLYDSINVLSMENLLTKSIVNFLCQSAILISAVVL